MVQRGFCDVAFSPPTHTASPASMQQHCAALCCQQAALQQQQQLPPLNTHPPTPTLMPGTMFCSLRQSVIFLPVLVDWNSVSSNMMAPLMYLPRPGVVTSSSR